MKEWEPIDVDDQKLKNQAYGETTMFTLLLL